jgi:hypothetical protein
MSVDVDIANACADCQQRPATTSPGTAGLCTQCTKRHQENFEPVEIEGVNLCDPADIAALQAGTFRADVDIAARIDAQLALDEPAPTNSTGTTSATSVSADESGEFDEVEPSYADRIRYAILSTADLKNIPRPKPLIDGLLYLDSLAMVYGPSGVGKSFVTIDMAMYIGSNLKWWNAREVANGAVLYVIAEGASGISLRTDAWEKHHGTTSGVQWHPSAINIHESAWVGALAEVVADIKPKLVVLDTLARSILGADENSSRDMGEVIANLDIIRRAAGSCVLVVHHSGKNLDAGGRGSTALKGAMDTELELTGDTSRMALKNTKQKNAPETERIWLKLEPVGESAVVVHAGADDDDAVPPGVLETLETLRSIEVPGGVPGTAWRVALTVAERTFYRHRSVLLRHKMAENVGTVKTPRYQVVSEVSDAN